MKRILERVPRRYLVEGFVVNFFFYFFSRSQFFFYKNDFDYYIYLKVFFYDLFLYIIIYLQFYINSEMCTIDVEALTMIGFEGFYPVGVLLYMINTYHNTSKYCFFNIFFIA